MTNTETETVPPRNAGELLDSLKANLKEIKPLASHLARSDHKWGRVELLIEEFSRQLAQLPGIGNRPQVSQGGGGFGLMK